jgi:transcriptional regulator with XRE-family HTH domain
MSFHMKRRRPGGPLGRSIRSIRRRLNLNQVELARILGWPRNMVTQYESHTAAPGIARLIQIFRLATQEHERTPLLAALEERGVQVCDLNAEIFSSPATAPVSGERSQEAMPESGVSSDMPGEAKP